MGVATDGTNIPIIINACISTPGIFYFNRLMVACPQDIYLKLLLVQGRSSPVRLAHGGLHSRYRVGEEVDP